MSEAHGLVEYEKTNALVVLFLLLLALIQMSLFPSFELVHFSNPNYIVIVFVYLTHASPSFFVFQTDSSSFFLTLTDSSLSFYN